MKLLKYLLAFLLPLAGYGAAGDILFSRKNSTNTATIQVVIPQSNGGLFITNGSGIPALLPKGTDGYQLELVAGVPTWVPELGGGNVSSTGTPTANQIPYWTNSSTIGGSGATINSNGTILTMAGGVTFTDSSGSITIAAAGTNQNITLIPSGTGNVFQQGTSSNGHVLYTLYNNKTGVSGGTQEDALNMYGLDDGSSGQQLGSFNAIWADATATTGRSQIRIHANHLGGGSNSDFRMTGDGGIELFGVSDTTWPGAGIFKVNGTTILNGITNASGTITLTASPASIQTVSNSGSAASFTQMGGISTTGRAVFFEQFDDSNAGTTFGISNAAIAALVTGTTTSNYPSVLVVGTLGRTAPVVFGVNGSEVGRWSAGANLLVGTTSDFGSGSGQLKIGANTTSVSTITGSLVNAGGFGNSGAVFIGGAITVSGTGNNLIFNPLGTSAGYINWDSTGGTSGLGMESSTGGTIITGSAAYGFSITSAVGRNLYLGSNGGTKVVTLDTSSNATFAGSISTAAPSGGTAAAAKHGVAVTTTGLILSTTVYLQEDRGGVSYKVATYQ